MKLNCLAFCRWKNELVAVIAVAAMFNATHVHAQGCPQISIQTMALATNMSRYGFSEIINPSTLPKRYLNETIVDHRIYNDTTQESGNEGGDTSYEENGHDFNSYDATTKSHISPIDGSSSSACSGFASIDVLNIVLTYDPDFEPSESSTYTLVTSATLGSDCHWSDGGRDASAMLVGWVCWNGFGGCGALGCLSGVIITGATNQTSLTSSWSAPLTEEYCLSGNILNARNASFTEVLDTENTDAMLRGNLIGKLPPYPDPTYPTNWSGGSGISFYTYADTNCLSATGGKMKYRFAITSWLPNQTYRITWQLTTTTITTSNTNNVSQNMGPLDVTTTGDPTQPFYCNSSEIDVPTISFPTLSCSITEGTPNIILLPSGPPGNGE